MSDDTKKVNVSLRVNEYGHGSVEIDGVDFSQHVMETVISTKVGEPTRVTCVLAPCHVSAHVQAKIDDLKILREEATKDA